MRHMTQGPTSDTTRVRQGVTLGVMRRVLAGSLVFEVLAFAVAWTVLRG
jgi:hypothetical protein